MSRLLAEVGEALYGPRWQSALARELGVTDRTVRRWASGGPVPARAYRVLELVAMRRVSRLQKLVAKLGETRVDVG